MIRRLWIGGLLLAAVAVAVVLFWRGTPARVAADLPGKPSATDRHGSSVAHNEDPEGEELARVAQTSTGEVVVVFDPETQQRVGIQTEPLVSVTRQLDNVAYGVLTEDPAMSFTLRAPVPGVLLASESQPWPAIGDQLQANTTVGTLEPRLSPAEQVDIASRLAAARAEAESAAASLQAVRASYESKKSLHDQDGVISERAVEEAEAQVKTEEAKLKAATEMVKLMESTLGLRDGRDRHASLVVPPGGEVVEIFAQPGEMLQSGQDVLRTTRFTSLVARVDVPVGEAVDSAAPTARIVPVGFESDVSLPAERIGPAPNIDRAKQGQVLLFRVAPGDLPLRPGVAVVAYVPAPGGPQPGIVIPRPAVVRAEGRAWAYILTGEDNFTRREVPTDRPTDAGWFALAGFTAGDRIVVEGAHALLSEELKPQIEREEAVEE
jgi:hypothetical protein